MSQLAEGIFECTVLSASFGDDDRSIPSVQINVRFDAGPNQGRTTTYQDDVNAKSALYVGRSCKAVGWKGKALETLKADADAWIKATGGKSTAEIKHVLIGRGKKFDEWVAGGRKGPQPIWDKCNAIGRGAKPLAESKPQNLADANDAMRRAMAEDAGGADEPAPNDDSLPFATCSTVSLGEVARVLRGSL